MSQSKCMTIICPLEKKKKEKANKETKNKNTKLGRLGNGSQKNCGGVVTMIKAYFMTFSKKYICISMRRFQCTIF